MPRKVTRTRKNGTRPCKYCKATGFHWKYDIRPDQSRRYYLADAQDNEHDCRPNRTNATDNSNTQGSNFMDRTLDTSYSPALDRFTLNCPHCGLPCHGDSYLEAQECIQNHVKVSHPEVGKVHSFIEPEPVASPVVQTVQTDVPYLDTLERMSDRLDNLETTLNRLATKISSNGHQPSYNTRTHQQLEELTLIAGTRRNIFLVGPAGSGKTTAAKQAAQAIGVEYYEASMGPATDQWALFGFMGPNGNYVPGVLREPFEKGGLLMLDEMDNADPSVMTSLNSAIENGSATFPDARVERHKDFILIAAGNTYGRGADRLYVGRNQLDGATLDRFIVIDWEYDEAAEREWAPDYPEWTSYVQAVRKEIFTHQMRVIVSPRASINGQLLANAGLPWDRIKELVLWKGCPRDDRSRIISNIGEFISS